VESSNRQLEESADYYVISNQCSDSIADSKTCQIAANSIGFTFNDLMTNSEVPSGCFKNGDDNVYFNELAITECSKEYQCVCADLSDSTYQLITSGYCSDQIGTDGRSLDTLSSPELCTIYYQYEVAKSDIVMKKEKSGVYSFYYAYGDDVIFTDAHYSVSEVYSDKMPSGCFYSLSEKTYAFNTYLIAGYLGQVSNAFIYNLCNADNLFSVIISNTCTSSISTTSKCSSAARNSGYYYAGVLDSNKYDKGSFPYGCFYNSNDGYVYFNDHRSDMKCSVPYFCFCFNTLADKNSCSGKNTFIKGPSCASCPDGFSAKSNGRSCKTSDSSCAAGTYIYTLDTGDSTCKFSRLHEV